MRKLTANMWAARKPSFFAQCVLIALFCSGSGCAPSQKERDLNLAWHRHADSYRECRQLFDEYSQNANRQLSDQEISKLQAWQREGGLISDTATTALLAYATRSKGLEERLKSSVPTLLDNADAMIVSQGVKILDRYDMTGFESELLVKLKELESKPSRTPDEDWLLNQLKSVLE